MNDNHFFADVDLPFHVWIREGNKWVLKAAPQTSTPAEPPEVAGPVAAKQNAPAEVRRAA